MKLFSPWRWIAALSLMPFVLFFRFALWGYSATAYFLLGVAVLLVVWHLLLPFKILKRLLLIGVAVLAIALIVSEVPVIIAAQGDSDDDAPYLVVLGCGINGTEPSLALVYRLNAALNYLQAHPDAIAVVSGGQGPHEDIPESQAMHDWLVARGISSDRILQENRSTSTLENLQFSFDVIHANGGDPADGVAIVSGEYHLYRAKYMAAQLGADPKGVAAETGRPSLRINYFLREAFAVWYLWVFGG